MFVQVLANFQVRIRSPLDTAKQLHDQPPAEEHRRIALIGRRARDRNEGFGRRALRREAKVVGLENAMPHRHRPLLMDRCEEHCARPIVEEAVVERPFARAGDARQQRTRVMFFKRPRFPVARHRQREHVALGTAIAVFDVDDREKRGMRAAAQRRPVREPRADYAACLAAKPALTFQERHERVLLDDFAHAAVEHRVPDNAGEERGDGDRLLRRGNGARRDRGHDLLEPEPIEAVRRKRQEVRMFADPRELGLAEHFDRREAVELAQRNLDRLHRAREIGHAEDDVVLEPPHVGEHLAVGGGNELDRSAAEDRMLLAQGDHPLHPVEQREGRPLLRLDVDRFVPVNGVHDRRKEQPSRIAPREAAVAIAAPLHRRADTVAIAEIDVIAHPDLVAVVDDRRAGHGEEQAVHQLDAAAAVLHQRRETSADAEIEPHLRVGGVLRVHVVALFVGHHLQRQLVMVAQEDRPLARRRDLRRLVHDLDDWMPLFLPQAHEHARHQREMKRHVAFVAIAEVGAHVRRPLVGFGQQHAPLVLGVELAADLLQHRVRFGQVLVDRPFTLDEIRDRIEPQRVDPEIEPEAHHVNDGLEHFRVVEIQVGLMGEEAMPVVLARDGVEGPVRFLGVDEDDARAGVLLVAVAPDVVVPLRRMFRRPPGPLKPWMLIRCVVDDELGQHADAPPVRLIDEAAEIVERSVDRVDRCVVRNVIPIVFERRRIERKQPQARNAEVFEVRQLLRQAGDIADAVAIAVVEGTYVYFVDECVFVPKGVRVHFESRIPNPESRTTKI